MIPATLLLVSLPAARARVPVMLARRRLLAIKQAAADTAPSARLEGQITGVRLIHVPFG